MHHGAAARVRLAGMVPIVGSAGVAMMEYLAGPGRRHDGFVLFEYR